MTKKLLYHHMPLQKQSTSTLLFPGSQSRGDCCDHLVCFLYYTGNRFLPQAGLKLPFLKAAQFPCASTECRIGRGDFVTIRSYLAPRRNLLDSRIQPLHHKKYFACSMEKPYAGGYFSLQVHIVSDLPIFCLQQDTSFYEIY